MTFPFNAQGSEAWHEERLGKLTASDFGAAAGLNPYKTRQKLWREKTGKEPKFEGNVFTRYGTQHEPLAIRDYEIYTGQLVLPAGFVPHRAHDFLGASPDGYVCDNGTIEVKCRFDASLYQEIPRHYLAQIYGVMACTERQWCDFISWAPHDLNIIRVEYKQAMWYSLYELLNEFWDYVLKDEEPKRCKKQNWGM